MAAPSSSPASPPPQWKTVYETRFEPVLLKRFHAFLEQESSTTTTTSSSSVKSALEGVFEGIPKVDHHCHLNGSISEAMLAHFEGLLRRHQRRSAPQPAASGTAGGTSHGKDDEEKGVQRTPPPPEEEEGEEEEMVNSPNTADILFFNNAHKRVHNILDDPTSPTGGGGGGGAVAAAASSSLTSSTDAPSHRTPKERMQFCFTVFDNIYRVMTNLAFTRLAVQEMVFCSAAEAILVMEIRTSLRDGLTRTFRSPSRVNDDTAEPVSEAVTKKDYLDEVIRTVQHLLRGGVVDFDTGDLLSLRQDGTVCGHGNAAAPHEKQAGTDCGLPPRWWQSFRAIYAHLLPSEMSDASRLQQCTAAERMQPFYELFHRIQQHLVSHMHVRLLVSVNRGSPVAVAEEAAALTRAIQHEQIYSFHQWCVQAQSMRTTPPSLPPPHAVCAELRRTCWVTGMDYSGNCYKGDFISFAPILASVRDDDGGDDGDDKDNKGANANPTKQTTADAPPPPRATRSYPWSVRCPSPLPPVSAAVTLHGGEKYDETELDQMVQFFPERWGHLVYTDPLHLSRILLQQSPIELCITSNLLTSGHEHVRQHHIRPLLRLWDYLNARRDAQGVCGLPSYAAEATGSTWSATENADLVTALQRWMREAEEEHGSLTNGGTEGKDDTHATQMSITKSVVDQLSTDTAPCYERTEAARLQRRTRRWAQRATAAEVKAASECTDAPTASSSPVCQCHPLPNLSFHTDDRGVFGSSLSHELFLISQCPDFFDPTTAAEKGGVCEGKEGKETTTAKPTAPSHAMCRLVCAMWALQRLALSQVFELPWPALWLAATLQSQQQHVAESPTDVKGVLLNVPDALHRVADGWEDWARFVEQCNAIVAQDGSRPASSLREQLSLLEWEWLTQCFDTYYHHCE